MGLEFDLRTINFQVYSPTNVFYIYECNYTNGETTREQTYNSSTSELNPYLTYMPWSLLTNVEVVFVPFKPPSLLVTLLPLVLEISSILGVDNSLINCGDITNDVSPFYSFCFGIPTPPNTDFVQLMAIFNAFSSKGV
jgi:hypothetical protein